MPFEISSSSTNLTNHSNKNFYSGHIFPSPSMNRYCVCNTRWKQGLREKTLDYCIQLCFIICHSNRCEKMILNIIIHKIYNILLCNAPVFPLLLFLYTEVFIYVLVKELLNKTELKRSE